MEKAIFDALTSKFEGVAPSIISRIAKKLATTATPEADANAIADTVTIQQLLQSYGDSRATEASLTAVENYKKAHPETQPKPKEQETSTSTNIVKPQSEAQAQPDIAAIVAKAIAEAVSPLQQQIQSLNNERTAEGRKAIFAEAVKDAPTVIKNVYEQSFGRMSFADDEAFNSFIEETKASVKAASDDYQRRGTVTTPPKTPTAAITEADMKKVNPLVLERAGKLAKESTSNPFLGGSAIAAESSNK